MNNVSGGDVCCLLTAGDHRASTEPNHTHRSVPHSPSDVHADLIGRVHLTVCSLTLPSVHPSTKDRRYQHVVYMGLCGKWASVGKLYCPGNE